MDRYEPTQIEAKWQARLGGRAAPATPPTRRPATSRANHWYQLEMLPYPSGTLHMGHVLNYSMGDVLTHFRRRNGWTVLRPMGWDSFGLPAENAAIREGGHPREIVERNIVEIRNQMKRIGWAIDWDREVGAHDPEFYRWTQWLFLRFYERGLAYRKAGAGQLVPVRPDRDRERVRGRRPLRPLRQPGRAPQPRAVVLQDHRLRRRAAPLRGRARLARAHDDDPAQLDRPERGRRDPLPRRGARHRHPRLHDAAGHAVRRDLLRARARAPARRADRDARGATSTSRRPRARRPRSAPPSRRRPASSPATTRRTP